MEKYIGIQNQKAVEIYWLKVLKLLEDTLGWKPKVTLSEGLDRTISQRNVKR